MDGLLLVLLDGVEELLGGVAPGAEVVLVEDDEVPVLEAHPLVLRLDVAVGVAAQIVLERAEAHDGARGVAVLVLVAVAADELPALEVDVALEVLLPGALDRRLEGEHEHSAHAHGLGELVGREGLAEAHLGVPEELGRALGALGAHGLEVLARAADGLGLLRAHGEVLVALLGVVGAVAHGDPSGANVVCCAAVPLALLAALAGDVLAPVALEPTVQVMVHEAGAVVAHGALGEDDVVGLALARLDHRELLGHAHLDRARGVADLENPRVVGVLVSVGVYRRMSVWALGEEVRASHRIHP